MALDTGCQINAGVQLYDARIFGLASQRVALVNTQYQQVFTDGSGAGQAQKAYVAVRTLAGSSESLDLNGVLTDLFGTTLAAVRVKGLTIKNTCAAHTLTFVTSGSNGWTTFISGTLTLPAGAFLGAAAADAIGWTVTAGTGDLLVVNGAASDTYEITVLIATA